METIATLNCPKCNAPMRAYDRNGVMVERCTECGGLFLDRGELERLITAEATYYAGAVPAAVPDDRYGRDRYVDDRYIGDRDDDDRDDDDRYGAGRGRRRRGGFLDDLFDFG